MRRRLLEPTIRPGWLLAMGLLVFLAGCLDALAVPAAPTNLQVDCVYGQNTFATNPTNCTDIDGRGSGLFQFRFTSPSAATAYELDLDSVTPPRGPNAPEGQKCAWLWNTNEVTKTIAAGSTYTVDYPNTSTGSCSGQSETVANQGFWQGNHGFYWRVRVKDASGWGPWSSIARIIFNSVPTTVSGIAVQSSTVTGTSLKNYGSIAAGLDRHVVASGGASSGTCVTGQSACTLTYALSIAAPGDKLLLGSGDYAPFNTAAASSSDGTEGRPITITKEPGASPRIFGTSTLTLARPWWVLDGLTITINSVMGIAYNSSNIIVKNCTINGSGEGGSSGGGPVHINMQGKNNVALVKNIIRTTNPYAIIDCGNGYDQLIRGNVISGSAARGLNCHASGTYTPGNLTIAENSIHAISGAYGGAVDQYYGIGEMFIARNRNWDCAGQVANMWIRGGWARFLNNSNGNYSGYGSAQQIYVNGGSDSQTIVDNAVDIHNAGVWHDTELNGYAKELYRYSTYWQYNGGDGSLSFENPGCDQATTNDGLKCITPTNVLEANPSLDPVTGKPSSCNTNSICNNGNPASPVPEGGGNVVDRGRFEYGATLIGAIGTPGVDDATGTYEYQVPSTWVTTDHTPRISWTFEDLDNRLFSATDTQVAFQIQIDTVNTFDSQGPFRPLCDSDKVVSSNSYWDVPAACGSASSGLPNGKYYFRIRTWDSGNHLGSGMTTDTTTAGIWSDYANRFQVDDGAPGDHTAPAAPGGVRFVP